MYLYHDLKDELGVAATPVIVNITDFVAFIRDNNLNIGLQTDELIVKLPFPYMWFEYKLLKITNIGVLAVEYERFLTLKMFIQETITKKRVTSLLVDLTIPLSDSENGKLLVQDHRGVNIRYTMPEKVNSDPRSKEIIDKILMDCLEAIHYMHYPGTKIDKVVKPRTSSDKLKARGLDFAIKSQYKELDIMPNLVPRDNVKKRKGKKTKYKVAYHLVRGHYRRYAPVNGDAPYRIWVKSFVRGSKDSGEISKTYKL